MPPDPFEADPGQLRAAGARLLDTADQVAATLAQAPPLVVDAPGWSAATAVGALERAAAGLFATLGGDIAAAADALRGAAERYAESDVRAAARFRAGSLLTGPIPNRPPASHGTVDGRLPFIGPRLPVPGGAGPGRTTTGGVVGPGSAASSGSVAGGIGAGRPGTGDIGAGRPETGDIGAGRPETGDIGAGRPETEAGGAGARGWSSAGSGGGWAGPAGGGR